jgi:RNA polymerase sigma-70 factor (ECF subfamily)
MTTDNTADDTDAVLQYRSLLFGVAYRVLGTVTDAEDVVQDAWLRWRSADRAAVRDPRAYLVTVTTRLAIDRLRAAKARRESYVGPWLPEPLLTGPDAAATGHDPLHPAGRAADVADAAELAESVSVALLVVLETLSPLERAVFVLREAFDFPHAEIAAIVGRTEPAVRQLARRARDHVGARRPRYDTGPAERAAVTERFMRAALGGDLGELMDVLAPDVVLVGDGGGLAKAPRRAIHGAEKVGRFLVGISTRGVAGVAVRAAEINGVPAIVGDDPDGTPVAAITLDISGGRVVGVQILANPAKLAALRTHPADLPGQADLPDPADVTDPAP